MKESTHQHIAIFASGRGSNAEAIIQHFANHPTIKVALIVTNKKDAGVIAIAQRYKIPFDILSAKELKESEEVLDMLEVYQIDLIVLAGFLLLLPSFLIHAYPHRILNIHPALLPSYGGKGMYGSHVHEAVLTAGDTVTGMTIHYVNEKYDEGAIILQERCSIEPSDTVDKLAGRVMALEHRHYPIVIERVLREIQPS